MAELTQRLEELPDSRRRLLKLLMEESGGGRAPAISRRPRAGPSPASFGQRRLWFLHQLEPTSAAYHLPLALRLRGPLDRGALGAALDRIVARHEALRTIFTADPAGEPLQVILPAAPVPLPVVEAPEARRDELDRVLASAVRWPFDLERDRPLRGLLVRFSPRHHLLLLVFHHIAADGWSLDILQRELSELYDATLQGRPPRLAPLTVQYADYAEWQREQLAGAELERLLEAWRERLADAPEDLGLPTDRPRPREPRRIGRAVPVHVRDGSVERLTSFAREERATLFMAVAAAYLLLLHRHAGSSDLVIGMPVAGRERPEIQPVVGLFINTLPLRVRFDPAGTFQDLLRAVRNAVLDAQTDAALPFERLVEEVQPERSLSRPPLFQVMLAFQEYSGGRGGGLSGLTVEGFDVGTGGTKFDLNVALSRAPVGLKGALEYDAELFDRSTALRLRNCLEELLHTVAGQAEAPLAALSILSPLERQQVVVEWNDRAGWSLPVDVVGRVLAHAQRSPEKTALRARGETLSYGELADSLLRRAAALKREAVGPETVVGLAGTREPETVVSMLAVLAAGGAYLPLDVAHPPRRLLAIIEDAGLDLLLTPMELADRFAGFGGRLMVLDDEAPGLPAEPRVAVDPRTLAYVLYTSGSTGRPKGVAVTRGALDDYIGWCLSAYGLDGGPGSLVASSPGFDLTVTSLLAPLAAGASVTLLGDEEDPVQGLIERLDEDGGYALLKITPSHLDQVNRVLGGRAKGAAVATLVLGGEALRRDTARPWLAGGSVVMNEYGPTEAVVGCAVHRLEGLDGETGSVPIGRPVDRARLYLLDWRLEAVVGGAVGEIGISGAGIARGYLHRPGATAERFVPDPFGGVGERLYRSGDLARHRHDGALEFLGRSDDQVKVRGHRVELGEIETQLLRYPGVTQAAVTCVKGAEPGEERLAAYVVAAGDAAPEPAELREFLAERLPEWMVPHLWSRLPELPLTVHGKLDRRALPDPAPASEQAYRAPRSATETALAAIWQEVLGVERVGVHDDFFLLGGHSLLATRMLAEIRRKMGVTLPLKALFTASSVAALATAVARERATQGGEPEVTELPNIEPDPARRHEPFPLNVVQQAYWIGRSEAFALGGVASHAYSEAEFEGLDLQRLELALQRLIARHDMLRMVVLPDGRQRILPEVPPYRIVVQDLRGLPESEVEERLAATRQELSHKVLTAEHWPLFEVRASRLKNGRVRLHTGMDALLADGWSLSLLRRDLSRLYFDPDAELPPLELSFRDYVLAELALRETPSFQISREYWMSRLNDLPAAPELPFARSPASLTRPVFTRRSGRLPADSWTQLKDRGAAAGLTPSGLLLAAFSEVLSAWSKSPRFTLNLTLFNRLPLHPQVSQVVGDFTSLTLLEVDAGGSDGFRSRAQRVQERLWEDLEHRLFGGIEVLRELARLRGPQAAAMPVVFTSTLTLPRAAEAPPERTLRGRAVYGITQTPQVWLDHQVSEVEGELRFNWDAVDELFPEGVLDAMLEAYLELLERLAGDPATWDRDAAGLVELPEEQRQRRLRVNDTAAPVPPGLLHGGFEEQARREPDRLALVVGGHQLTYGELDRRSRAVARRLRDHGAVPNRLVAVVMEKGWEQVVGVLGVLRAGAAYLPVDPALPQERIEHLLRHGEVSLALTQAWVAARVTWPTEVCPLPVEEGDGEAGGDLFPLPPPQAQEDLAYVIFTSGSTGQPKGVVIDHRGALNTVADVNRRFGLGAADRVFGISSLGFDLSVWDVFGTLAAGGTLVLPEDAAKDAGRWSRLVRSERVTVWNSVPALAEMLAEHAGAAGESLDSLRLVMMSGDWIPVSLPERLRRVAPEVRRVSLGGATEASIWSIFYPIEDVDPAWKSIPYGCPLGNQFFRILDHRLTSRPDWVTGELYIGGIGVARGYWRDVERTEERFLVHPVTGDRLYRTGDLGCYLPSGDIEFLGREDFQVKVNGYRIELGEIEAALERHPKVGKAVAVAIGERERRRLVGYYTTVDEAAAPTPQELSSFLGAKLPSYMVPSVLVPLDQLPLTANGKIDRKSLPAVDRVASAKTPEERPATPVEELIVGVLADLLDVDEVGLDQDFYILGGDSLVATRLVARLRDLFAVEVPLRDFLEEPTARTCAALVNQELRGDRTPLPPIEPVPRRGPLPTSLAQRRLWFLARLAPESPAYLVTSAAHLRGALDVGALAGAFSDLTQRHEVLRTRLIDDGNEPVQVIEATVSLGLAVVDLERLRGNRRELERLMAGEARRPMDVTDAPLARTLLVRLAPREHALLMTLHHAISDAWSLNVALEDLSRLYEARRRGESASLAPLPAQYGDFAVWQRRWLAGETLADQLAFWRERLGDDPEPLELPTDRPRSDRPRSSGRRVGFRVPEATTAALEALGRRRGATLFMVLLASLQALLHRWTGREDIAVGTPVGGRRLQSLEGMIGFFVNTLVLRTDLGGDPDVATVLDRVRAVALDAYAHQDVPFDQIVEEVGVRRDLRVSPMFQVMLILQNAPPGGGRFGDLEISSLPSQRRAAAFELTLSVTRVESGLTGWLEYRDDLFDAATIQRLARHLGNLMQALATTCRKPLSRLPLMSAPERHQILVEWDARQDAPEELLLHRMFERQVDRRPGAIALSAGGRELTYGDLEEAANGLARDLIAAGTGREPVAVLLDDGPRQAMALLAVLKSGAPFVALDPGYPPGRSAEIVAECGARLLVAGHDTLERQPEIASRFAGRTIWLPRAAPWRREEGAPADRPHRAVAPESTAYLVYTSGSTGRPKGIVQSHRSFAQFLREQGRRFRIGPGTRFAHWATITYDASYCELLGALCRGATLCAAPASVRHDPEKLGPWLDAERVTVLQVVPSFFQQLAPALAEAPPSLETVMLAGEVLPPSLVRRWRELHGDRPALVNLYGPTEAVLATAHRVRRTPSEGRPVPLGRPMTGRHVVVLDGRGSLCPIGIPGEIHLRSPYLTDGYLARPAETATAYRPDPFGGGRVYATGDVGRVLPDGEIELIGRRDGLVKVRGIRVEPGEVESRLLEHPTVVEAAVGPVTGGEGLAAWVVVSGAGARETVVNDLRGFLRRRLPEAMVPAAFTVVPRLPRTRTGKIDRGALPAPEVAAPRGAAPRNATERVVAEIWCELLGLEAVDVDTSFFDLGGHSLLATRVANRLRERLSVDLPLDELFRAVTVADLAAEIERCRPHAGAPEERVRELIEEIRELSAEQLREQLRRRRQQVLPGESRL